VRFDATLLRGDSVVLQLPFPPYLPPKRDTPLGSGGSQLWVQTNSTLFCMEALCAVNATGQCQKGLEACAAWAGNNATLPAGLLDSQWTLLNYTLDTSGTAIHVDLAPLGGRVLTAVRYAWGIVDCCDHTDPNLYVTHGCVAACPIMSSSGLPANPFQAKIENGRCACVTPQVCDG
jgi:hypothetical protein